MKVVRACLAALLLLPSPVLACTLCFNVKASPTIRKEATVANARLVLFGRISDPKLKGAGGVCTFTIEQALHADPTLEAEHRKARGDTMELPHYIPVQDPKNPPRFLIFCDVYKVKETTKYDPYRGVPGTEAMGEYAKGALALDRKDTQAALLYYARFLEHEDKEIAQDAFLEYAKASDADIGKLAGRLDADKLRKWLKDENTPSERLGLYSFLLAGCGQEVDVKTFESLLENPGERLERAYDGILSGYVKLRPKEGWQRVQTLLADGRVPVERRLAAVRTIQFFHGLDAKGHRAELLKSIEVTLTQGELSDLAVELLRRWQEWDYTKAALATWSRKGLDAPIMKRAVMRYALCCPGDEAKKFVAERRKDDPDLVKEVEESLKYEQDQPKKQEN